MGHAPQPQIYSVSDIVSLVKGRLEQEMGDVWVAGEISNLRAPSSGHLYFTLKDAGAQLRAVLFRFYAAQIPFKPADGLQVIGRGRLTVYEPRGDLQLVAVFLEPQGYGALQLAFEQLKARLAGEGLFDESRKKPIPLLPRRIGLVTSPTGAAIKDILNVLGRRNEKVSILIAPSKVQGEGAAGEIAGQIRALNEVGGLDVIIVSRGGGSVEDLWPFNEEVVARAIGDSAIPVISAVGHEIDFTISDFVADLRAPTPSAAAELVSTSRQELWERLGALTRRLRSAVKEKAALWRRRLTAAAVDQLLSRTIRVVSQHGQKLDDMKIRLERCLTTRIQSSKARLGALDFEARVRGFGAALARNRDRVGHLEGRLQSACLANRERARYALTGLAARLESLDPRAVLKRGYSICRRAADGAVLRAASEAARGTRVSVELYRGSLDCEVLDSEGED